MENNLLLLTLVIATPITMVLMFLYIMVRDVAKTLKPGLLVGVPVGMLAFIGLGIITSLCPIVGILSASVTVYAYFKWSSMRTHSRY